MATKPTKPTVIPPKPTPVTTFDLVKCQVHLENIEKEMLLYAGKPGCNPYLWLSNNVQPIKELLNAGNRTPELQARIMALKAVEPKI